jgi:S1-C subfamily serine protease
MVALAVVVGVCLLLGGVGLGWGLVKANVLGGRTAGVGTIRTAPQQSSSTGQSGQPGGSSQSINAQSVANKVEPAMVDVNTTIDTSRGSAPAAGTGMIVTSSGEVLTNNHVVEGATSINVTIVGRSGSHPAKVLGVDPTADVALIQIEGVSGLPTVKLADSSSLTVGENVVAIGNAGGQGGSPTVTQGTITALNQSITAGDANSTPEQLSGLIQTDAPIQAGDSGGALANADGQVVGMITAGSTQGFRQQATTVGYAITATAAADVVNQIQKGQASSTIILGASGYLGVGVQNLDAQTAAQLGLSTNSGALVTQVVSGAAADQAGIQQGSVITRIGSTQITSTSSLGSALQVRKPGTQVQVSWTDQGGGSHSATVTLGSHIA